MSDKVQGRCPWCGGNSLFLGSGGYVTCSHSECDNPSGITDLLDGETEHIVVLRDNDFTIQHPMRERLAGELFECGLHGYLGNLGGPPRVPGRYRVMWREGHDDAIWLTVKGRDDAKAKGK
jgi:hypothetical protein